MFRNANGNADPNRSHANLRVNVERMMLMRANAPKWRGNVNVALEGGNANPVGLWRSGALLGGFQWPERRRELQL